MFLKSRKIKQLETRISKLTLRVQELEGRGAIYFEVDTSKYPYMPEYDRAPTTDVVTLILEHVGLKIEHSGPQKMGFVLKRDE